MSYSHHSGLDERRAYISRKIRQLSAALEPDAQSLDGYCWKACEAIGASIGVDDLVLYIVDDRQNQLIQKAAFGAKERNRFEIKDPITIPIGEGIVGSCARHKTHEIVFDTTEDPRYLVDDEYRLSEIACPIVHNDKLIGVLDSEDRRRAKFDRRHLSLIEHSASNLALSLVSRNDIFKFLIKNAE